MPRYVMVLLLTALWLSVPGPDRLQAQTAFKEQAPRADLGQRSIPLFGPAGFQRVDGLDHDIDEMLNLLEPEDGRELAIFSDPAAWKDFYAEIYGREPKDLALYASIAAGPEADELDFIPLSRKAVKDSFPKVADLSPDAEEESSSAGSRSLGQTFVAAVKVETASERGLTLRADLGLIQAGQDSRPTPAVRYRLVTTVLEVDGQFLFLNLYGSPARGPSADELYRLAEAWRNDYLAELEIR